jgi:endonuclease/exonuclease/phosphatase family metal-dependent hydrolase
VLLTVVSYNIHRAIGMDRRFRPERIARVVAYHGPDILLLQEVDEGVPRSRELDLAREIAVRLDYPHYAVGHNVELRRGRYGNATLSRFPMVRQRNIDLTIERRKRRGCQHTTLSIVGSRGVRHDLEIFNLHLGLSARERAQQVGLLACSPEFAELVPTRACLVAGDFNDWRSLLEPAVARILGCRLATRNPERASPIRTYPSFSPRGGLDRVYYRGPIRVVSARACRLRASRLASDHLPVVVDLELA